MENIPVNYLIYVAVVAIMFLRWLAGQFRRASERRQEMMQKRMEGSQVTQAPRPDEQRYEQPAPTRPPALPQQSQPQTLQELFEQRRQEIAKAQQQVAASPPPLAQPPQQREQRVEVELPPVTEQSQDSRPYEVFDEDTAFNQNPRRDSKVETLIGTTFSDQERIRQAFILKEILDRPKGFDL